MVTGGLVTLSFADTPFSINFLKFGNNFFCNKDSIPSKQPPSIPNIIFLMRDHLFEVK